MAVGANLGDISRLLALAGLAITASGLWWSLLTLLYGVFLRWIWRTPPAFLTLPRPLRRAVYHFWVGVVATLPLALIQVVQLLSRTAPPELTQRTILQTAIAAFPDFVVPYFWLWWIAAAYGYHWFLVPRGRSQDDPSASRSGNRSVGRSANFPNYAADVEYALEELRRELEQREQEPTVTPSNGTDNGIDNGIDNGTGNGTDEVAGDPPAAQAISTATSGGSSNIRMLAMVAISLVLGLGVLFLVATVLLLPFPDVNLPLPGLPRYATATIVSVGDGDTLRADMTGRRLTIRLACIDAPESAQPGGTEATAYLRQLLIPGKLVGVRQVDVDIYGRTVAELYRNGESVNVLMVREGHAVVYPRYLDGCPGSREALLAAAAQAKAARRNFWSQPNPEMPWEWRRRRRRRTTIPSGSAQDRAAVTGTEERRVLMG